MMNNNQSKEQLCSNSVLVLRKSGNLEVAMKFHLYEIYSLLRQSLHYVSIENSNLKNIRKERESNTN